MQMPLQEMFSGLARRPAGTVDVVLDSDMYNEVDDQFALSYLLRSQEKLCLKAIYAAPFTNEKSAGPADGMEKSYQEIHRILDLAGRADLKNAVYRGSEAYLHSETEPVLSDAAKDLARRAMQYTPEAPLYVIAIGAITNVASALLLNPEIKNRMVLVWLGGHAFHWPDNREFNLYQDVAGARVVCGCGVPLVLLPCMGVVSELRTTEPELACWLQGKNALCDYLLDLVLQAGRAEGKTPAWSRVIWDVAAVAWLLSEEFVLDQAEHSPIPEYDGHFAFDHTRHLIRYCYHVDRDRVFFDLFF